MKKPATVPGKIRNRIRELRTVRASSLAANSKNWRVHPQAQVDAMQGILNEIGYAGALLARELPDGSLVLIDGHLRAETTPDEMVPVLILDVTAEEADKLLLSYDPLAAMAESNAEALESLLASVSTNDAGLQALYAEMESSLEAKVIENPYSSKITIPPYDKIGAKPPLAEVYDMTACNAMLEAIAVADITDDLKHFLIAAAYRHVVFNYQEAANFYAHSTKTVQELMEDSAMVIIDVDRAIANGWAQMNVKLDDIFMAQNEEAENA